jgi:hypothetical protein
MKTNSIVALFLALIVILAVNPKMVNNMYSSVLGRLFLIIIVIFLSMKNVTLGLLVALTIIAGSNQFGSFSEGLENMDGARTIGEENVPTTGQQIVLTNSATENVNSGTEKINPAKQRVSDLKTNIAENGVDREAIKSAIMAKDSNTIKPDPSMMTNENVEAFTTNMLTPSSLTEGFYSAAMY